MGRATGFKTGRPTEGFWRQSAPGARAPIDHPRTPGRNRRFAPEDVSKNRARPDQHFDHHGNRTSAGITLPMGEPFGQALTFLAERRSMRLRVDGPQPWIYCEENS